MSINTDNNCDKNFNAGCKSRFKDHLIAGAVVIVLIICSALILNALNKPDNSKRWEPIIGDQDPSEAVFCEVVFPPKLCELTSGRTPEELIALDGDSYLDDDGNAVQVITYQDVDDGFYTYYLEAVNAPYVSGFDKVIVSDDHKVISVYTDPMEAGSYDKKQMSDIILACVYIQLAEKDRAFFYDAEVMLKFYDSETKEMFGEIDMIDSILQRIEEVE